MSLDHWLAFVAASAILLAIPGPTVVLVTSYALTHGRRSAAAIVAGVALGDLTAMTASMLGLGVILASSATIFMVLRWIGGVYLIYLGIKLWRAPVHVDPDEVAPSASPARMFFHSFAVTALNPKSIIFFVAFVPQFIDTEHAMASQMFVMVTSFVLLATLNATTFALLASAARQRLRRPSVKRLVNRIGGSLLMGAGLFAAGWRKAN